jgi:metacaspase-1
LAIYENRRTDDNKFTQCKVTLVPSARNPERARTSTSNAATNDHTPIQKRLSMPDIPMMPNRTPTSASARFMRKLKKTRTTISINTTGFWKNRSSFFLHRNIGQRDSTETQKQIQPVITKRRGSVPLKAVSPLEIQSLTRCESPERLIPLCDGRCREKEGEKDEEGPLVMALSACNDAQRTWESNKGSTMTQIFVKMLESNPHPKLAHMMDTLGHKIHNTTTGLHKETSLYKERVLRFNKKHPSQARSFDGTYLNANEHQEPQLSSLNPLDMTRPWNP